MAVDVLSDVLRAVRLTGAVYFDFELSSPWALDTPPSPDIAPIVMPGAQRVIEYHVIAEGTCWASQRVRLRCVCVKAIC
ncbi:MAG TPA: cupin domain-containing protein [Vicinamibacterales bacterium]|nr:cupin domain-containing protein [Vicinamibacterales bacterium]